MAVEYHWAEDQSDRLPALAVDLVRRRVAVLAATSTSPALAAKAATTSIPIVFMVAEDPVRLRAFHDGLDELGYHRRNLWDV